MNYVKGTSKNPCLSFEPIFFSDTSPRRDAFGVSKILITPCVTPFLLPRLRKKSSLQILKIGF